MNNITTKISILIPSYNTCEKFIVECINSIINQKLTRKIEFEIVWIDDGSDEQNSTILCNSLKLFDKHSHIKVIYKKLSINKGIVDALNTGLSLCSNELIFRMDSDDRMLPTRIQKQVDHMDQNIDCMICGTQISCFKEIYNDGRYYYKTPENIIPFGIFTFKDYLKNPVDWIMCHPTLCYRKSAINSVGNYDTNKIIKYSYMEDLALELKFLKKYGFIYNIKEPLLYYRVHNNQITKKNSENGKKHEIKKLYYLEYIKRYIYSL